MSDSRSTAPIQETIPMLDVRDDLRDGREPFSRIMALAAQLHRRGEKFLLIAPFEPAPLFQVLAGQGFAHSARQTPDGSWEVLFTFEGAEVSTDPEGRQIAASSCACSGLPRPATNVVEVDARGLEPPQPLVRILEALAVLPDGAECRARTDRRPMHLYAQLAERGFAGQTEEQEDGSFITRIQRV
jgi:uncharacterized protein (DUF2249 family)